VLAHRGRLVIYPRGTTPWNPRNSGDPRACAPGPPCHSPQGDDPWNARCDDDWVTDTPRITDNQAASRFELVADGKLAELQYRRRGNRLVLIHTGVPAELEGHGLGGALVAAALERAEREGLTVVPLCPFAQAWLDRHPEAAAEVTIDQQALS